MASAFNVFLPHNLKWQSDNTLPSTSSQNSLNNKDNYKGVSQDTGFQLIYHDENTNKKIKN